MLRIAYLANLFPSPLEAYVVEEIQELRHRGVQVVPCSAWRRERVDPLLAEFAQETLYLQDLRFKDMAEAGALCWGERSGLKNIGRSIQHGHETWARQAKAVLHTALGALLAHRLKHLGVTHIHVHHGYFASWVAMVAAQLLGITYTMTLHGSDLLVHRAYLETKLENCAAAFTVSEYNRRFLLEHYPMSETKLRLRRLGTYPGPPDALRVLGTGDSLLLLNVARLHPIKNQAFLVEACARLKARGFRILCLIAGEGPERAHLQRQIHRFGLEGQVKLLGHVPHEGVIRLLGAADLFVLTSHSEGIPVAAMEAMAHGVPVLAPDLTGIPELVIDGETGFLYRSGSLDSFINRLKLIQRSFPALGPMRKAARCHIAQHFNQQANLREFVDTLLEVIPAWTICNEDPVLQQVQLSV